MTTMSRPVAFLFACASAGLVSCTSADAPGVDTIPRDSSRVVASRLEIHTASLEAPVLVDDRGVIVVSGYDASGNPVATSGAGIAISDPTAAEVIIMPLGVFSGGATHVDTYVAVHFVKAGHFTITARLGAVSATTDVDVLPADDPTNAIAVDSFAVVEFSAPCEDDCPYIGYVPVFRVRETTGQAAVTIVRLFVELDARTTIGQCRGDFALSPGESREIAGLNTQPLLTDLLAVRVNGSRVVADSARARLVVRDATGRYARVETRGRILKIETDPVLPAAAGASWSC
jgi:hypothetical protein